MIFFNGTNTDKWQRIERTRIIVTSSVKVIQVLVNNFFFVLSILNESLTILVQQLLEKYDYAQSSWLFLSFCDKMGGSMIKYMLLNLLIMR